jgi:hypothetical protein
MQGVFPAYVRMATRRADENLYRYRAAIAGYQSEAPDLTHERRPFNRVKINHHSPDMH